MIGIYNGTLVADAKSVIAVLGEIQYRQLVISKQIVSVPGRGGLIDLVQSAGIVTNKLIEAVAKARGLESEMPYRLILA